MPHAEAVSVRKGTWERWPQKGTKSHKTEPFRFEGDLTQRRKDAKGEDLVFGFWFLVFGFAFPKPQTQAAPLQLKISIGYDQKCFTRRSYQCAKELGKDGRKKAQKDTKLSRSGLKGI